MDVVKTLTPGAAGTQRYLRQYGDRLVCVRYRQDKARKRRYTTIETIVDEGPLANLRTPEAKALFPHPNQAVLLRIGYKEEAMRARVKAAGGKWLPDKKLWRLPYRLVEQLGLQNRVVM